MRLFRHIFCLAATLFAASFVQAGQYSRLQLPKTDVVFKGQPVQASGQTWRQVVRIEIFTIEKINDESSFSSSTCTAVIVGKSDLLLAAHCIDDIGDKLHALGIQFFENGIASQKKYFSRTDYKLYSHPDYKGGETSHDLAMIQFENDVFEEPFGSTLIYADDIINAFKPGTSVVSVGAGTTEKGSVQANLAFTAGSVLSAQGSVLTVAAKPGAGVCKGDSGGPLLWKGPGGRLVVIGIASRVLVLI